MYAECRYIYVLQMSKSEPDIDEEHDVEDATDGLGCEWYLQLGDAAEAACF